MSTLNGPWVRQILTITHVSLAEGRVLAKTPHGLSYAVLFFSAGIPTWKSTLTPGA